MHGVGMLLLLLQAEAARRIADSLQVAADMDPGVAQERRNREFPELMAGLPVLEWGPEAIKDHRSSTLAASTPSSSLHCTC